MCRTYYLLNLFFIAYFVNGGTGLPFEKCKGDDAECIKATVQAFAPIFSAGLPEYGVKPLDPLVIKKVDASSGNLKLIFYDLSIRGLRNCVVKRGQRDISKSKMYLDVLCTVVIDGKYEAGGQIVILPIEGKSKAHLELKNILVKVECDIFEKEGKDGKPHWSIKRWTHGYELKDKTVIQLDNLFNGNELLGRATKEFLATSSNEIIIEVGSPVVKAIAEKVVKACQHFFNAIPAEDLSEDHYKQS